MILLSLAVKAVSAGAIVLGLSVLAERVGPRIAGIIAGAPLGALITFYMLGLEQGTDFVVASVPHAIAGMSGVLVFVAAYHWMSLRARRMNALSSTIAGMIGCMAVALVLERVTFTATTALPVTIAVAAVVSFLFRRTEDVRVTRAARLTLSLLVLRAGSAALLVVSAVGLAKVLGPRWAGLLVGFPLTLLPTMLIVHLTYSREHVLALLKGFPIGIGSVLTYLIVVPWSFPALGVHFGTAAALAAAWCYLVGLSLLAHLRRRR